MSKKLGYILMAIIITTILVSPLQVLTASGCSCENITIYQVSKKIARFEEKVYFTIPSDYGVEVPEGAYYTVNVYGVNVGRGVILIDCGVESMAEDLYDVVLRTFRRPILAVYLTHGHADHAGGGSYFQEKGVPIYAAQNEIPIIANGAYNPYFPTPDEFLYTGYMPDHTYEKGELYHGFNVKYTIGHTMGSVSITYEKGRNSYIFTGDTILEYPTVDPYDFTFILSWFTAYSLYEVSQIPGTPDYIGIWTTTLKDMENWIQDYDTVCPGHKAEYSSMYALAHLEFTLQVLYALPYMPSP